jgi:hypothetical protein
MEAEHGGAKNRRQVKRPDASNWRASGMARGTPLQSVAAGMAACCRINPAFRFRADLIVLRICQAACLKTHRIAFALDTWNQHDHAGVRRLKVEEQYAGRMRATQSVRIEERH